MSYRALLFCPDEKTARVTTQVLTELDFTVEQASDPFAAVKNLMAQHFDAIVVDCENEQNATLIFKSARNSSSNQSSLSVAVVEGQAGVAKAFRIGANLVLTKPINIEQSKGTLRVARGLLRKGAEGAKSTAASSAKAPSPASPTMQRPGNTEHGSDASVSALGKTSPAFTAPKYSPMPAASMSSAPSGALESEPESSPRLDPSEAAVLESLPNTVPDSAGQVRGEVSSSSKSYPWQPTPKSGAGPMAAALQKAAEVAGKAPIAESHESASSTTPSGVASKQPGSRSVAGTASGSGVGAAAAPARAKEARQISQAPAEASASAPKPQRSVEHKPQPITESDPAMTEAPSFGMEAGDAEAASGRSKRPLIVAVALVVVGAALYFGWATFHGKVSQPAANPVPAQSVPAPALQPVAPEAVDVTTHATAEATSAPAVSAPTSGKSSPAVSAKNSPQERIAEDKTVTLETAQPMIVKSEGARPVAAAQEPEAEAPNALGISGGSSSTESDLSNVVSSLPASMPQAVPQIVNISQGVSQGLVLKKVQPVYPAQALAMRLEGPVQLQATISETGNIRNLKVISGQSLLARAASDAVRQWKYKPYFLNGQPVAVQTQVTVNFKLPN